MCSAGRGFWTAVGPSCRMDPVEVECEVEHTDDVGHRVAAPEQVVQIELGPVRVNRRVRRSCAVRRVVEGDPAQGIGC